MIRILLPDSQEVGYHAFEYLEHRISIESLTEVENKHNIFIIDEYQETKMAKNIIYLLAKVIKSLFKDPTRSPSSE